MRTSPSDPEDAVVLITIEYARARGLSDRETAVFLEFVVHNRSNKQIAAELGIGYPTVMVYWNRIFLKLGCENAAGAMLTLLRFALVSHPRCHQPNDTNVMA
jgi:DNA-binding CsgD family transcriptional regulator